VTQLTSKPNCHSSAYRAPRRSVVEVFPRILGGSAQQAMHVAQAQIQMMVDR
jgi:hypothetical protein